MLSILQNRAVVRPALILGTAFAAACTTTGTGAGTTGGVSTRPDSAGGRTAGDTVRTTRDSILRDTTAGRPGTPGTMPGSTTPGSTMPGSTTPGSTMPGSTTPGSTMPGSTTPGSTMPGSTTPGSTMPGSTSPGVSTSPGASSAGVAATGARDSLSMAVDSVATAARSGLTSMAPARAATLVRAIERSLSGSRDPNLQSIASDLRQLGTALERPTVDRHGIGTILGRLGPKVSASVSGTSPLAATLQGLGDDLTRAAATLHGTR